MNRTLLKYYDDELDRFRKDGNVLSRSPRARALQDLYASGDPFVIQLVQAFAYTQARIELKLDSERDRLPSALLHLMHPSICRPIPPRTIVQFGWGDGEVERLGREIPAGTPLRLEDGDEIPFRTTCNCILPPVVLKDAALLTLSEGAGATQRLRLTLDSPRPDSLKLSEVRLNLPQPMDGFGGHPQDPAQFGLRLFLGGAESQASFKMYDALTRQPLEGRLVLNNGSRFSLRNCIRPAGFDTGESLLPADSRQLEPMRLMAEYALMREKFLFVDLIGLHPDLFKESDGPVSVDLLLEPSIAALVAEVGDIRVRLGCVPIVNLKEESLRAIPLHRVSNEFVLTIDSADAASEREIFSVTDVRSTNFGTTEVEYLEMFRPLPERMAMNQRQGGYWNTRRAPRTAGTAGANADRTARVGFADVTAEFSGSDVLLSLVEFKPAQALEAGRTLQVNALCFNRDVKRLLNRPLKFKDLNRSPCDSVCNLYQAVAPNLEGDVVLRLIEHLSCGVGLLQSWGDPRTSVSRFLALFGDLYRDTVGSEHFLSNRFISALGVEPTAAPLPGGFARGVKLRMEVDPGDASMIYEAYLLLRVLEVALSAYCSAGGFIQLSASYKDGRDTKEFECPARIGKIALI
ncbi:MAG TPA: type VI secretion system baseplate subunit TssF [Tepidisphaeraceae bacterium]|jgi:type VI secretion system protein ImpG|nr:type VI secretion system baseplate subunit TssF [Tepidisphaeraceae bacterium]